LRKFKQQLAVAALRTDTRVQFSTKKSIARSQWLMSVVLATQEAEIRRIMVQSQPRQMVPETLS
jgi:hypothetical protein